ncbi:MAG: DUF443 family protein [Lachnospiraceae bacterium]|jgi:uncharacterized membrane protein (TIGR01218 family)|nr:DUF443 family protein [Lachnospiraceae bacterium]
MSLTDIDKKMIYKYRFGTAEGAEAFLIECMNEAYVGKDFVIIHDDLYKYQNNIYGVFIKSKVKDKDGIVACASVDAKGISSLKTDYLNCYFMPKIAAPVKKILNEFEGIENYCIEQNIHGVPEDADLNMSLNKYFIDFNVTLSISVILPAGKEFKDYFVDIKNIYEALRKNQLREFHLNFILADNLYYGVSRFSDKQIPTYFGYFVTKLYWHYGQKPYRDKDIIFHRSYTEEEEQQHYIGFQNYGSIWKYTPLKLSEDGNVAVFKKQNLRYALIHWKDDYYLLDYARPNRLSTYFPFIRNNVKIRGYKVKDTQLDDLQLYKQGESAGTAAVLIGGFLTFMLVVSSMEAPFEVMNTLLNRIIMFGIFALIFAFFVVLLSIKKPPISIDDLEEVEIHLKPKALKNEVIIFLCYILAEWFLVSMIGLAFGETKINIFLALVFGFYAILLIFIRMLGNFYPDQNIRVVPIEK